MKRADVFVSYGVIGRDHPLASPLGVLLGRVAADPLLRRTVSDDGTPVAARCNLRARPGSDERWEITHFSWCAQWRELGPARGFRARTLLYERRAGEPRLFDFPDDPWLPGAAKPGSPLKGDDIEILRYIPTRRLTFRAASTVGKMKRGKSLQRSHARLTAVFEVVRRVGATFAVPEPRRLDVSGGVFYQELMPGRPVEAIVDATNGDGLLRAVGAIHREIHELEVPGVPAMDQAEVLAKLRKDQAWLGYAAPAHAAVLEDVSRRLQEELAGDAEQSFCHGDLAIDQVLVDGAAFAVVDFDDAVLGDPYAEIGTMLAMLPYDAPSLVPERAAAAYLDGYRARAGGPLDERRLRAYHARAELGLLAGRLRKGLDGPEAVARSIARLRALVGA